MVGRADIPEIDGIEGLTVIGRGGFATVYRGRQPAFHRDVAVKVLQRSELDTDDRRRFERECQAMGALSNHPGIVTLYDAGFTADERPYLVMSYVADGSLQDRLAEGPVPWRDVSVLGVRLAGALETAHRAGVVHRDVKPANVLRSAYGEQLTDFGIARLQGGHETLSGVITASVAHAAPEILDGSAPDARADIYSLGSTLYASLAGSAAYVRGTDEGLLALIHRVGTAPLPDLREKGVPGPLAEVVETAMAKDPNERYATAEDLGHAVCDVQSGLGLHETDLMIVGGARGRDRPTAHPTRIVTPRDGETERPPTPPDPPTTVLPRSQPADPTPPPFVPPAAPPGGPTSNGGDRNPAVWAVPLALGAVVILAVGAFVAWPRDDEPAGPTADATPATVANTVTGTLADETIEVTTPPTAVPATSAASTTAAATTTTVAEVPVPTETDVLTSIQIPAGASITGSPFTGIDGIAFDPFRQQLLAAREPAPPDISATIGALAQPAGFSVPIEFPDADGSTDLVLDLDGGSSVTLLREDGAPYGTELDVEGMAVLPDGSYYVVSEGNDPDGGDAGFFAHRFDATGRFVSELPLPDWYRANAEGTRGFTPQRGLHGIDNRPGTPGEVVVIVEAPLLQDTASPLTEPQFSRIIAFDVETGEPTAEWAYPLDPVTAAEAETTETGNLVIDMAALSDGSLAVFESTTTTEGREYLLYRVDLGDGGVPGEGPPPLATKTLIPLDANEDAAIFRSLAAGPEWVDGRSTLLLASDNAFGADPTEFTMIAVGAPT